jgi:hypothetical protein
MVRYQEFVWDRDRDRDDFYELSHRLPTSLQKRIALAVHMPVFLKLHLLQTSDKEMLADLALALTPTIFTPGDFLLNAGRISQRMLFIVEGVVALQNPSGAIIHKLDGSSGTILGEASILRQTEEPMSVVACTYLEAFELSKADFDRIGIAAIVARAVENLNEQVGPPVDDSGNSGEEEELSDMA